MVPASLGCACRRTKLSLERGFMCGLSRRLLRRLLLRRPRRLLRPLLRQQCCLVRSLPPTSRPQEAPCTLLSRGEASLQLLAQRLRYCHRCNASALRHMTLRQSLLLPAALLHHLPPTVDVRRQARHELLYLLVPHLLVELHALPQLYLHPPHLLRRWQAHGCQSWEYPSAGAAPGSRRSVS